MLNYRINYFQSMKEKLHSFISGFQLLSPEEVDIIVENTNIQSYPKGTILLKEGQVSQNCYMVIEGLVREYRIVDGIEKTTAFYSEFQPVNSYSSSSNNTPAKHFLICAEDSTLTLGTEQLEQDMIKRIPRLETVIRQEVERVTGLYQDELSDFITSSPEQRYQKLLQERSELLNRVPQHQIASYIGVSPEHLSRIRKKLAST